jgi:hypothetical protein
MKADSLFWSPGAGWSRPRAELAAAQLVLYFGSRGEIASGARFDELRAMYPKAEVVGCSTGGQIFSGDVTDGSVAALALHFDRTAVAVVDQQVGEGTTSVAAGQSIGNRLARPDLKSIFVLSDGLQVNGSELVAGIGASVGPHVTLTGGLAGDGADFKETLVGVNSAPTAGRIAAVGFYGSAIAMGHGSAGGWDEFGPQRRITKSKGNVLFELDGQPALDLYERYLGEDAAGLPGTALLYPLLIADPANPKHSVVRTILAVDREASTMTFAGDVPEGWSAQLMRGYFDRLADGAAEAARQASALPGRRTSETAAIMVSCIGRRILMGQQIIDEVAAAEAKLGENVRSVGFYSYGEISPHAVSGMCELHNQTMTVTTIAEAA